MASVTAAPDAGVAPARRCAYAVLRRVYERGAYADQALQAEAGDLRARDRALAMRLAYGTVQRTATLDHVIGLLSDRPPAKLDPPLLAALRLGVYELLYMHGAPDYAVVGDAVELAKAHGRGGHGLVNAVLRRAAREGAEQLLGALSDATAEQAALKHSHPEWVARLWWRELGAADARALMAANNEPGELALRANTLRTDAERLAVELPVRTRRDPLLAEALVAEQAFDVQGSPPWRAGAFNAQSRAAMLVAHALGPRAGERVLDLCAAPGGKATHLAALMEGRGEVVAVERDRRRAGVLARNAERLGANNVRVELADAELARSPEFDRVLVDPPCSGLGTLQAHPDLRWRMRAEEVPLLAAAQARILAAGAAALRPGGVLVYSTCTTAATENQSLIAAFLDSHPDFSIEDLSARMPGLAAPAAPASDGHAAGALLTLPHRDHTAGFYIARLRRSPSNGG